MIISSQRYIDQNVVAEKIVEIDGSDMVTIPVVFVGEIDGETAYVVINGHHTREAAQELEIEVQYETVDANTMGYNSSWTTEEWLDNLWTDSDWYNVETGELIF